jgi:hypothetical protein
MSFSFGQFADDMVLASQIVFLYSDDYYLAHVITETNRLLESLEFSAYFVAKQTARVHVCMPLITYFQFCI